MVDIDLNRLAELRDRHRTILENYRRAGTMLSEAARELAAARNAAMSPAGARALCQSDAELVALSPAQLGKLQLHPKTIATVRAALARVARLSEQRKKLSEKLADSAPFAGRIEQFARSNGQ